MKEKKFIKLWFLCETVDQIYNCIQLVDWLVVVALEKHDIFKCRYSEA